MTIGLAALVFVDILEVFPPLLLKRAVDIAVLKEPVARLAMVAWIYLGLGLLQGFGRYGWRMYLIRSSILAGRDLRLKFTEHLFGLSASFFDRRRIGDLMSLATSDVDAVRMAIGNGLLTFADALFYMLTVPVAMYLLSPKLTLLAFLPLPFIPWIVIRNEREIHSRFERVQELLSRLSSMAQENLGGIRIVKAFAREDAQVARFSREGAESIRLNMSLARVQSSFGPTLDFFMSLGMVLLLFVGGASAIDGAITLGTFVAFQRYIQKMVWPMAAMGLAITHYQRSAASTSRLGEILAEQTDVPEPAVPRLPVDYQPGGAWRTRGEIEFRHLSFRFPGATEDALHDLSLTIGASERVAFAGVIGSGKTALLGLLPRLYPVAAGMIFVDGVDVNEWPLEELRRQVGYVSQDVFLFSESVIENVAFGLSGAAEFALRSNLESATALANVHDDVVGLAFGYQTRLGERGVNLSGGQKQRLTLARALAKEPAILVLDDALSSVDVQTEEKILRSLRARPARNTEMIAAHRISTLKDADRIVVLAHGQVHQLGGHAQLIGQEGAYRRFYEQQRLKEDLESFLEVSALETPPRMSGTGTPPEPKPGGSG